MIPKDTAWEGLVAERSNLSAPLQFLAAAQSDPELSSRVLAAVERGNLVTEDEVLKIAQDFGYSFTRDEFQNEVLRSMSERFGPGVQRPIDVEPEGSPESSCSKGCLSWTHNWHPPPEVMGID
jgi:hypothetical protein